MSPVRLPFAVYNGPAEVCRKADKHRKVAIDIGVSHPAPAVKEVPLSRTTSGAKRMNEVVRLKLPRSTQGLIRLEKELIANFEREGPGVIAKALADEARVYRFNALPVLGRAAKNAILAEAPERHTFSVMGGDIARSGDWGYVYGSVTISGRDKSKAPTKAAYMRVWEKDRGKWKIFLEVITS